MLDDNVFSDEPTHRPRPRDASHAPPRSGRPDDEPAADEPAGDPHFDHMVLRELFGPFAFGPVQSRVRHFPDGNGTRWRVYERLGADEARPSLFFESTHAVRRVRVYPTTWHTLSDAELERLSWER
jgi:hypothetical protein